MDRRWGLLSLVVGLVGVGMASGCVDRQRTTLTDGQLTVSPGGMQFQRVAVFDGREVEFTLRSVGRMTVTVQDAWVEGPAGQYVARFQDAGPHKLSPGEASQLKVRFTPLAPGDMPATLVIQTDSSKARQLRVPLTGTGVDAWARISPSRLDFGRIEADSSKTLQLALENPSDLPVEVNPKFLGTKEQQAEFSMAPLTLAPFEKREVPVTFSPHEVGIKNVVLAITPCRGCADVPVQVAAEALEQAVIAVPPDIDFGAVPLDRDAQQPMSIKNISTEPVTVTGFVRDGKDASFSGEVTGLPLVLQPGETRSWTMTYSPGHPNLAEDSARFTVQSKRHPTTEITMRGFGGASEVCLSPSGGEVLFGEKPLGSKTFRLVTVKNCGADNGGPLRLLGLSWGDAARPADGQFTNAPLATPYVLQQGEEVTFKIFYEPVREGPASDVLVIRTDAYNGATVKLNVRGSAVALPPCDLKITPEAGLDFGTVPPRKGAVLGFKVLNQGQSDCAVKNLRLRDDGGGTFNMPGGAFDGLIIPPGNYFSFQVGFTAPEASGRFEGMMQIQQANPADPLILLPLRANVQSACLVASPRYLDFGAELNICPPPAREVNFLNACSDTLTIRDVAIGAGTTDGEFKITDGPKTLPFTLAPGEAFTVAVDYAAKVPGMNLSPLYVDTVDLAAPLMVPLIGESSDRTEKTDTFIQQDAAKVDVLFVVDNTPTMVEEQPRFTAALPAFVDAALQKGVDMHAAVTTTGIDPASNACPGGAQGGEAGRFFPVDNSSPRIVNQNTPNLAGVLQNNSQVGLCSLREEGFEAMRRALSVPLVNNADDPRTATPKDGNAGFLRDEAALAVVFVGDEDDNSPDEVLTYVKFLQEKKGENQPQRVTVYAIAPTKTGCASAGAGGQRYAEIAKLTGGEVQSICAGDYAPLLRTVANKAFSPQNTFPLSSPATSGSIQVTVNGTPATGWHYDADTQSVVFDVTPPPGAKIAVSYRRACS
ncbi:choice-of-anchor D domain-containing protein [Aggregicoccus sp. 17bor-14]|uniref:choice-of-anchor D domain-containing protein n=1 Tax=Myxococcaceae TaxID=31 RepID=UPI00129C1E64|nr:MULTISPECIES: choice-of-anchor D domain-containing protein [Myxococcaceae]MBF5041304.1 choice-of-anchor D domain-containing protein [Simulacricoccus sp. 17bor-14]MRI87090.1 choice-of-anchor D domain-containing protein [Aggregicoccus sp. 17bor-14]